MSTKQQFPTKQKQVVDLYFPDGADEAEAFALCQKVAEVLQQAIDLGYLPQLVAQMAKEVGR